MFQVFFTGLVFLFEVSVLCERERERESKTQQLYHFNKKKNTFKNFSLFFKIHVIAHEITDFSNKFAAFTLNIDFDFCSLV